MLEFNINLSKYWISDIMSDGSSLIHKLEPRSVMWPTIFYWLSSALFNPLINKFLGAHSHCNVYWIYTRPWWRRSLALHPRSAKSTCCNMEEAVFQNLPMWTKKLSLQNHYQWTTKWVDALCLALLCWKSWKLLQYLWWKFPDVVLRLHPTSEIHLSLINFADYCVTLASYW